jgi:hypothetical protein
MERSPPNLLPRRTPALRVRELLPLALLALACGAVLYDPFGCTRPAPPAHVASSVASAANAEATASFAALAARGATIAPGMREVARMQSAGDKVEIARAEVRDACVRVAFKASSPVVAKLVDGEGNVLASSDIAATDGVLGQRGPVCVRRGDAVSAVAGGAEGPGGVTNVRWVAWESP